MRSGKESTTRVCKDDHAGPTRKTVVYTVNQTDRLSCWMLFILKEIDKGDILLG